MDAIRRDDYQVVVVTEQQKTKLEQQSATGGEVVRTIGNYLQEYNQSFQYQFIEYGDLTETERNVFDKVPEILALIGLKTSSRLPPIKISESIRLTNDSTEGVWDSSIQTIVIRRKKLKNLVGFAATLLHEIAHATTGTVDATREFESILTGYLGLTSVSAINFSKTLGNEETNLQTSVNQPTSNEVIEQTHAKKKSLFNRLFGS